MCTFITLNLAGVQNFKSGLGLQMVSTTVFGIHELIYCFIWKMQRYWLLYHNFNKRPFKTTQGASLVEYRGVLFFNTIDLKLQHLPIFRSITFKVQWHWNSNYQHRHACMVRTKGATTKLCNLLMPLMRWRRDCILTWHFSSKPS